MDEWERLREDGKGKGKGEREEGEWVEKKVVVAIGSGFWSTG